MARRHHPVLAAILLPAIVLIGLFGCAPDQELSGVRVPNAMPDTRITGTPPVLLDAGFVVQFYWTGRDPDGNVRGFQWKMSDNGLDGISVQDTMTYDPATGDTLNPWHFTTQTDTMFIVSADVHGFERDEHLEPRFRRAFQSHTFFVRTVDEEGGVDPSPASVSFTATTLLPTIRIDRPERLSGYQDIQAAPPTVTFGYTGTDPDFDLGIPAKIRYLWKKAVLGDPPHYVRTEYEFRQNMDKLVSFSDSAWSAWIPYNGDPEQRLIVFRDQQARDAGGQLIAYLFAIQAQDTAGAVSVERVYGRNVHNVFISPNMSPLLSVRERHLGGAQATGLYTTARFDIAQGQLLEFDWVGSADRYAGIVEAYRYGWDLTDFDDENDPNWAVLPGNTTQHRKSSLRSFGSGTHILTIQCWDNSDQMTRMTYVLEVVPVPDVTAREHVLLVDDVKDSESGGWQSEGGAPLDNDRFRDAFWDDTLARSGGVAGFDPARDVFDAETDIFSYRDLVRYLTVIWSTRYAQSNYIWENFKPESTTEDRYIWLSSYQESVGNLFLCGQRVLSQFIEEKRWMLPWVFDSAEEQAEFGNQGFFVGFGTRELPDGTIQVVGRDRYPYRTMGVSLLDQLVPRYNVYARIGNGSIGPSARNPVCVGVKGLVLDDEFKLAHMPEGGVFADTIFTNKLIDWRDSRASHRDSLRAWDWGGDELYDSNISLRLTPWTPQVCDEAPCVEPMFRILSRFDWIKQLNEAAGNDEWPAPLYDEDDLEAICGRFALDAGSEYTLTTSQIVGFVTNKMAENKPNRQGDVVWGFDPYRFDNTQIQAAIRWVLGDYFLLPMSP